MLFKKIIPAIMATIVFTVAAVACAPAQTSKDPVDNTAASLVHDPIYYWNDNNVPYDADNDCQSYCFITPYLAAKPTGGAILVFPGGGYNHLSNDSQKSGKDNDSDQKEASLIAPFLQLYGIIRGRHFYL